MDILWRVIFILAIGSFVWFLHRGIGKYPDPLPRANNQTKEIKEVLFLWAIAVIIPIIRIYSFSPWLEELVSNRTIRELIQLPLLSIPYLLLPLYIVLKLDGWKINDLGLSLKCRSKSIAISAIIFGLITGGTAYITNEAVIGIESMPAGVLILLLYNNDFLEEFFHRGIIQAKLERAFGQSKAVFWGGILFGLTHVVFDLSQLLETGIIFVFFAFVLQTMAGWLLGIVYMKTRCLWPGVACHYLANWLPAIMKGIFG